jgi:hypothetical protein
MKIPLKIYSDVVEGSFHLYRSPYLEESGGGPDPITPHFDWTFLM